MKQILIACAMLEDEINKIYEETGCTIPVVWVERGYHNTPEKLKEKLQSLIEEHQDVDEILLSFGLCGNGANGIVSPGTVLVLPKFDDCINMLLCRGKRQSRGLAKAGSIYLTRGWTLDSESILKQYEKYVEEYGEESAEAILEMMYEHYEKITVIDTACYDTATVLAYARKAANMLDLTPETTEGSTEILRQLLTGRWEENFIVLKPGQPVKAADFEWEADSNYRHHTLEERAEEFNGKIGPYNKFDWGEPVGRIIKH